ncbi:MAG: GAF domain-containing protein [Candidatus Poseidoniia archaeon]|nr:GAF domain-containing protein [Candidatus Poseidoniia archaeon]MDP6658228.1 GAF domain-containing protein [Candidatus Poseidoniia archaeon]MDP6846114.1 GAF domain-containing protein [Candidatus Poseidoniia archaeon]
MRLESAAAKILAVATDRGAALREIAQLLDSRVEHYDWIGFYLVDGRELVLGPYVGAPTEHVRIPFGRGVCGQVAESGETLVVPDVAAEANYLSCGSAVRSEVVIPIHADGMVVAQLDIDSHTRDPFSRAEVEFLQRLCVRLARLWSET